eukprot:CCRYP_000013-RA/>CCRYP_000013-RA protein AED:0.20 eAED:0.20 QI:186/1/1/1/1/1/2/169/621
MDFVGYLMRNREVNLDKLKELAKDNPDEVGAKILEYGVLNHYLCLSTWCPSEGGRRDEDCPAANIDLNVVEFLLDLAPDAANKADAERFCMHPNGSGAYPLHLACFNADCPVSIVKLLVEKNPLALKQSWREPYVLPLHCYLARACVHPAWGYEDDEMGYVEEIPAFPSGELDYDIVKLLVDAYPEAVTHYISDDSRRSALHILCEGFDVSMELMQLLVDKDGAVLNVDGKKSPLWTLLYNSHASPFPVDVFRYLFHDNPSALNMEREKPSQRHEYNVDKQSSLQIACSNPNMKVEVIEMLIKLCPDMTEVEDRYDGCLPLHTLCKNEDLEEQSAIEILKSLVNAYPKSLKKQTWEQNRCPSWLSILGVSKELPITLAEGNMSFGFCKAILSEHARHFKVQMVNILHMACVLNCSLDIIQKLVREDRTLLRKEDEEHCIALHKAVKHKSLEIVKFLVQEDENSLTIVDNKMEVALHKACRANNLEVVKYLVDKNASTLRMGNHNNELPLHLATKYASVEVVKYLVEADESTLILPNKKMELALHTACRVAAKYSSVGVLHLEAVKYMMNKFMGSLAIPNHCNELPVHILCLGSGKCKNDKMMQHIETIFMMLRLYPEAIMV